MDADQQRPERNTVPCYECCDRISFPKCWIDKEKVEPLSSWIKLVAVVFINILLAIPEISFGIFYDYLQDKFDSSTAAIGWIYFVHVITSSLTGLAVSPFVVFYGCRPVAVIFVTILALGMSLCSVAQTLPVYIVCFGLIGGIGFGGTHLTSLSTVQQCFPYNRGLATGIATLGYTAGTILSPMLVEFFLKTHTLEGALLLHGALFLQGLLFAMLLKSPDKYIQRKTDIHVNRRLSSEGNTEKCGVEQVENNATESGELESNGCKQSNIPPTNPTGIRHLFKNIFDLSILKERPYLLLVIHMFFLNIGRVGLLSHTVSAAIFQGIPSDDAAYLFTIMGFVNLVTRVASSLILNLRSVNPVVYSSIGTVLLSASSLMAAFASNYKMFVICMVFLGGYEGITNTVLPMVFVHIIGVERFAKSFAVTRVCCLPAPMIGAPFAGWLMDITGTYMVSFLVMGFASVLSTSFAITIYVVLRTKRRKTVGQEISSIHQESNHSNN